MSGGLVLRHRSRRYSAVFQPSGSSGSNKTHNSTSLNCIGVAVSSSSSLVRRDNRLSSPGTGWAGDAAPDQRCGNGPGGPRRV